MNFSNNFTGYDIYRKIPYVTNRTRTLNTPFARGYNKETDLAFIGIRLQIMTNHPRTIWIMGKENEMDEELSIVWTYGRMKKWTQSTLYDIINKRELHEFIENPNKFIYRSWKNETYYISLDIMRSILLISHLKNIGCNVDQVFFYSNHKSHRYCGKKEIVFLIIGVSLFIIIIIVAVWIQ